MKNQTVISEKQALNYFKEGKKYTKEGYIAAEITKYVFKVKGEKKVFFTRKQFVTQ